MEARTPTVEQLVLTGLWNAVLARHAQHVQEKWDGAVAARGAAFWGWGMRARMCGGGRRRWSLRRAYGSRMSERGSEMRVPCGSVGM
eukprot:3442235-Prymnesium_polylepis.1